MTSMEPKAQVEVGVLTDRAIRRARENGELWVEPFDAALVRPAALSLRLGHEAFTLMTTGPVDVADRSTHPELILKEPDARGRLVVEPGEVVLAPTLEKIGLSENLAGLVDGTSDYARLGISVVLCGQVSPGFGRDTGAVLTLEIVNHLRHPVLLYPGTRICNLMLFASSGSELPYGDLPHNYSSDHSVVASRLADHVRHN
ncbi:dCTP deaminase [Amycolatopsis mediterranei S699]|uniref:dCTP deaminase n=2 Tax=Amycolatopsis mediterranei TaxID=33910 RepID=A0A0H3DCP0_AMYMU|nr:dCTP deaminase [Amycolatopsis mediterranei]ADJ48476.1 dCTP deaminase [Amycolatopsis mediterranei U32]AEK45399.1 deoxycytidine triphosphate deaminase [Amycolatopsis mediterranei S699]AFO80187.1 dCTP deaminase [Amycolatopsis mediterranei S699]AGT87315.1 dCTP deaminase [Amycolatopsis mediterranei RB]KDO10993.1 dCTP deaminase [Amycolatopsis mediterranei]